MLDDIKQCVVDATEVTSIIEEPDLRREAFKIILSKLVDIKLRNSSNQAMLQEAHLTKTAPSTEAESEQMPVISPSNSTVNNVRSIFATEWATKRRTVNEINRALDANGVPDPKHISTALSRLVDSKELLRIKQGEVFVYWGNPAYEGLQAEVK